MKRLLTILVALLTSFSAFAQAEKSIIIEQKSFRAVQTDALTGVNIDPIGLDYSKRPCARLKVKINRMTKAEIDGIEVKPITNNAVMKCKTAEYDNGLIIEMTAKPQTRFYFHHNEFGDSNEVIFDLEADKEYYLEAYLNQTFSIIVNSNVAGAAVYIDDKYCGETSQNQSLTVKDVMIGSHTLQLEYGKIKHTQTIEVNSGSISFRQNVNTQASKPQFVVFVVEPSSAVVTIEDKHYTLQDGAMRVVLDSGTYSYTVTAVGYHPQRGTFNVAGEKVVRNISLTADAAQVTLTAPGNAEIWVNDEKKGVGTWSGTLTSGTYIFEARKAGYRTATLSKHITSDNPQQSYSLPAPTPIYGSIMVDGSPIMADVTLDGKPVGQTPLQLDNILVGEHTLTVSKAGYTPKSQKVTISEAQTASVNITLTKTSSVAPTPTAQKGGITSAPYKVGDYYNDGKKEGVVFEVSADGKHGKIVSMTQSSKELQWSSDKYGQEHLIGASSKTDGAYNMQIVDKIAGWQTKDPAFKWCANLGEGWYLPAIEELKTFTLNDSIHDAVNRTLAEKGGTKLNNRGVLVWYWSSTEDNSNEFCAWDVDMYGGYTNRNRKTNTNYVRAVATFGDALTLQTPTAQKGGITSAPYKVGDYYNDGKKEGVVFEVSADGKHGKIVSMTQSGKKLQWSSDKYEQERRIGAHSIIDGAYNMSKVKTIAGWQTKYPAFKWCADLGEGWYLPAIEELKTFTQNDSIHDAVNRTLVAKGGTRLYNRGEAAWYWSSTEDTNHFWAWYVIMSNGLTSYTNKPSNYYVRAVATFGDTLTLQTPTAQKGGITSAPYKVGDYYNDGKKEGVVFKVSAGGKHGKIVSMTQSGKKLLWSSDKYEQDRLIGANSKTDGAYNMQIVKKIAGWQTKYPAFKWCADLGEGWYLPAIEELKTFTLNDSINDAVNRTLAEKGGTKLNNRGEAGWYLSSTEDNSNEFRNKFCVWGVNGRGSTGHYYKSGNPYVRAVSAF